MPKRPLGVLSMGVLILVLATSASLHAAAIISLPEVFSLTFLLFGLWVMALAGFRAYNPEIYGHGAFNILSGGALITTLGVIWFLHIRGLLVDYLLAVLLLVVGMLVAVAGIRAWRK